MAIKVAHPVVDAAGGDDNVVAEAGTYAISALIKNPATSGATVYLGPQGVTTTGDNKGFPLEPGEALPIDLDAKEVLRGAVAAGSVTLDVIINRGAP